jgi:flagellar hook-basal body complex protein FliE
MKVTAPNLFEQMQVMAQEATNQSQSIMPNVQSTSSGDFGALLNDAINTVNGLQADAKAKVTAFEMGDRSVTLAEAMIASQKSSIAFEATVQVRNKLVEAYKDIMNMPI